MFYYIFISTLTIIIGYLLYRFFKTYISTYKLRNWQGGDIGVLTKADPAVTFRACKFHPTNEPHVIILGWSEKEIFISLFNGERWYIDRKYIKNISLEVRERTQRVDKFMSKIKPAVKLIENKENNKEENREEFYYNGKPLSQLNKNELQEILDVFIKEEDYEMAAKIRDLLNT